MKKMILVFLMMVFSVCAYAQQPIRIGIAPHSSARIIYEYLSRRYGYEIITRC